MRERFLRERQQTSRISTIVGIALTAVIHVGAVVLVSFSGLKYIYPPPEENSFLMEVLEEDSPVIPKPKRSGIEPKSENVDKEKPVELIQKSESPNVSEARNLTPAAKDNGHGDVEVPAPPQEEEPKIDPRASFPGMAKKDTSLTAPHSAEQESAVFKAGQADGNTATGKAEGKANAHVEGRNVLGTLPKPNYNVQQSGTVVIRITVNQEGQVKSARYEVDGSTISSTELITAARNAAMKSKFTPKLDAPAVQEGTITYRFTLK